jgi:hypothetical protein
MSFLTEFRAKLLAKPSLLLHPIGVSFGTLASALTHMRTSEEESEWLGCSDHTFENEAYKLIVSVEAGVVVAYAHDTDIYRYKPTQRIRKLDEFLNFYGSTHPLSFTVNNGFGLLYQSNDNVLRAAYSYTMDIFSVSYFRLNHRRTAEKHG